MGYTWFPIGFEERNGDGDEAGLGDCMLGLPSSDTWLCGLEVVLQKRTKEKMFGPLKWLGGGVLSDVSLMPAIFFFLDIWRRKKVRLCCCCPYTPACCVQFLWKRASQPRGNIAGTSGPMQPILSADWAVKLLPLLPLSRSNHVRSERRRGDYACPSSFLPAGSCRASWEWLSGCVVYQAEGW